MKSPEAKPVQLLQAGPSASGRASVAAALLGLVIVAAALRLFRIDTVSVRGDEAFTIFFSVMPLNEILAVLRAGEPHPPGFFLTFRFWELLTGPSPFAARYFSALASVAIVPLAYQLTRLITVDRPVLVGFVAATLVTLSPDLMWHAQDARMYSLMAALMLGIWIAAFQYLRTRRRRWLVAYASIALYGVLVHYYLSVGLVAVNAALLVGVFLDQGHRGRAAWFRAIGEWSATQVALIAVLAPWFYFARNLLSGFKPGWTEPTPVPEMIWRTVQVGVLGTSVDAELATRVTLLFLSLTVAGLIALLARSIQTGAVVATCLLGPIVVVALLSIRTPIYLERYLVYLTPLVLIVISAALVAIAGRQRLLSAALAVAVVLPMGAALGSYYFDVRFAKAPEWREAALTLKREGQPGDVMVENFPDPAFGVHYRGAGGSLPFELLPPSGEFDPVDVRAHVQRLIRDYDRVWFLPIQADNWDKNGLVERDLRAFARVDAEYTFRNVRLLRFRLPDAHGDPIVFDRGVVLRSVEAGASGDLVQGDLAFRTSERLAYRAKAFVHLLAPDGKLLGQADQELGSGVYPSDTWSAGDSLIERFEIRAGSPVPAGATVRVGIYDPTTGRRLPLATGSSDCAEFPVSVG